MEVTRKLVNTSRSTNLTLIPDTTVVDIKQDATNYNSFQKKRKAWINKHGSGINEVSSLKSIFYAFLFSHTREKSANNRKLVVMNFGINTVNPFYRRNSKAENLTTKKRSGMTGYEPKESKR